MIRKNIPNLLTVLRIIGAVALLFTEPILAPFYIIYSFCGLTDLLDGFLARTMKVTSELGGLLDSIADLLFYSAGLYHLIPYFWGGVPGYIWYAVGAVFAIRLAAYVTAAVKYHRFASLHTYGNKLTGLAIFCVPYLIPIMDDTAICLGVCIIGAAASFEEFLIHLRTEDYSSAPKTIFASGKNKRGGTVGAKARAK